MLKFEHTAYFYLLLLIPAILILLTIIRLWKKKASERFASLPLVSTLMTDQSKLKKMSKTILYLTALFFLIIGIANPQLGTKVGEAKQEGIDIMICLDVSNSMKAEDVAPNRLESAKQAISRLTEKMKGNRIGVIVFAGNAYTQLPITSDYSAAKLFLSSIDTDIIPNQGTAIGAAITLAVESFGSNSTENKAIIVITDGENHEDDAMEAASIAADKNIKLFTVGMGSPNGAPIPIYVNKQRIGFKKDNNGSTVVTKLNENMLKEIAAAGKGSYVRSASTDAGLNIILNEINKIGKEAYGAKTFSDYESHYQFFALAALLLLIAEQLLNERKVKWLNNLNLFQKE